MRIGAQLYTVRDACQNLKDLDTTLAKVADIGYRYVQVSGTCDYEAAWLKGRLDHYGLTCVLTHIPPERLQKQTQQVVTDHQILACRHIGLGCYWFRPEDLSGQLDEFENKYHGVAQTFQKNGFTFMYHNHGTEFLKFKNQPVLLCLAERFAKEEMGFTLDTFWTQYGGADSAYMIELLSGRVPCIHLKDMLFEKRMAPIGEGNIHFSRVFEAAEKVGTQYMLVEQDDCYGEDPFDCLARSYRYLKAQGFE